MSRTLIDFTASPQSPDDFVSPDPLTVADARLAMLANRNRLNQRDDARELLASMVSGKLDLLP